MDNYLYSFKKMSSLSGLTRHTLKNYCTYIQASFDYLTNILHKRHVDVSWQELQDYIQWLQICVSFPKQNREYRPIGTFIPRHIQAHEDRLE